MISAKTLQFQHPSKLPCQPRPGKPASSSVIDSGTQCRRGERTGGARRLPYRGRRLPVTRPVLCTYGARSNKLLVRVARSLARVIATAQVIEIEGAAHAPAFDDPDNFVRILAEAAA